MMDFGFVLDRIYVQDYVDKDHKKIVRLVNINTY